MDLENPSFVWIWKRERESWRNLKATMPSAKVGKGGERETIKGLCFGFPFNCHFGSLWISIFNFSMCPIKWLWHYGSEIKHIFFPQTKFNLEFQLKFVWREVKRVDLLFNCSPLPVSLKCQGGTKLTRWESFNKKFSKKRRVAHDAHVEAVLVQKTSWWKSFDSGNQ